MPKEAVVLVGGLGARLGALTKDTPKPMLIVAGKPFLEHFIVRLVRQGIHRIILAVAYHADKMKAYFGDGGSWGAEILYSDPRRQLGTAGSIKEAEPLIQEDKFFAFNGDVYFNASLAELWDWHVRHRADLTLALAKVIDEGRYGRVQSNDSGLVTAFLEKTKTPDSAPCLINGGAYVVERRVLAEIPKGVDFSLEYGLFPTMANKSLYALAFPEAFFIDIGTPADYERAQALLSKNLLTGRRP
ncbi:MAG: nucleotidyltransferase family protein [Elusimicrobia bacterium]|nr:nucleotidyltransferase family protein [Elusimicrobiota bacterium]